MDFSQDGAITADIRQTITLRVNVRPRFLKIRMAVGMALIKAGARIAGVFKLKVETND